MDTLARTVLVVDDDRAMRRVLQSLLSSKGYGVVEAESLSQARERINSSIDLIVLDQSLPDGLGIEYLGEVKASYPKLPVLMLSNSHPPDLVVKSVKLGAHSFFPKKDSLEHLLAEIGEVFLGLDEESSKQGAPEQGLILENSGATSELVNALIKVAPLDSTVLLTGESGTGKSSFTQLIHSNSKRSDKPLVSVNCAALPANLLEAELFGYEQGAFTGAVHGRSGRLEAAAGGTLFLDEVGELTLELQAKLLLFIEDKKISRLGSNETKTLDVRIVAATNRDLESMVEKKEFRSDLLYRLSVVTFTVPPLRDRVASILPIARLKLRKLETQWNKSFEFSAEVEQALRSYSWPGNIRELNNSVEQAAAMAQSSVLQIEDFGSRLVSKILEQGSVSELLSPEVEVQSLQSIEKSAILNALIQVNGHRAKAAQVLGISERNIYKKIKKYGLADCQNTKAS